MRTLTLKYILPCLLLFSIQVYGQSTTSRPKIGLTLSGGGAKGLAHIGILKAIDSAGLKIDYITGTSMGSIMGSLYAVGYSADTIEKIARSIDWDLLLSNQSSLRSIFMEEKEEYSKYILELPWVKHRFKLPSGVLQGQELWLKFSDLFFPVYKVKDFSQFNIPFRCIGTDVGTGEAVVMKEGEIISAVRSSMAIPSVFTAFDFNGRQLIDGGVVRNFPVRDVKEMGANIVIGSNVANGLLPSDKVRNVLQVLLQIAFFREDEDAKTEVPQCDIYIPFHIEKYSMGSFADAPAIIQLGLDKGRELYPVFKHLKDSLDAIYGPSETKPNRLPPVNNVRISSYEVHGTEKVSADFFIHTMDLQTGKTYSATQLANMVRQAFGTRYYTRIIYSLIPQPDSSSRIVFNVIESPLTFAKLGLHYNRFSGVGLVANLTARNFIVTNSRSLVTLNLGESFRVRGEHLQYLGRRKNFSLLLETQYDRFDFTTYNNYKQDGVYTQHYFKFGEQFQFSISRTLSLGIGHRFEFVSDKPSIISRFGFNGNNSFHSALFHFAFNSLDKAVFPKRGLVMDAEFSRVFQQHKDIDVLYSGETSQNPDSNNVSVDPYWRSTFSLQSYLPFGKQVSLLLGAQSGISIGYKGNVLNEFVVGGLTRVFHNQITFAGLPEGSVYTPSVAVLQGGLRVQLFTNTYLTGQANLLFENFVSTSNFYHNPDFFSGYALTYSYNFALGPLEISAMYCNQSRKVTTYINLGIPF